MHNSQHIQISSWLTSDASMQLCCPVSQWRPVFLFLGKGFPWKLNQKRMPFIFTWKCTGRLRQVLEVLSLQRVEIIAALALFAPRVGCAAWPMDEGQGGHRESFESLARKRLDVQNASSPSSALLSPFLVGRVPLLT